MKYTGGWYGLAVVEVDAVALWVFVGDFRLVFLSSLINGNGVKAVGSSE